MAPEQKNELSVEKQVKLEQQVAEYLDPFGWERMDVGIAMMKLSDIHGVKALAAMRRFIDWAEENSASESKIAVTLGHDLKGCDDENMVPRTASY